MLLINFKFYGRKEILMRNISAITLAMITENHKKSNDKNHRSNITKRSTKNTDTKNVVLIR